MPRPRDYFAAQTRIALTIHGVPRDEADRIVDMAMDEYSQRGLQNDRTWCDELANVLAEWGPLV